jgi:hypothetical protein
MLLQRAQGLIFVLIGLISLVDGWRITLQAREAANFDAVGPDRYLLALGVVLLSSGAWSMLGHQQPARQSRVLSEAKPGGMTSTLVLTLAALAGFAALTPLLGFSLACFLFLALQLWLLASWPWWRSLVIAAVIAAAFHVTFISLADMPMPKGALWN